MLLFNVVYIVEWNETKS